MKNVLITGGTSGIGQELVAYFAKNNCEVLFTGRNTRKAEQILAELSAYNVQYFNTDFSSFARIVETASHIASRYPSVDILINNAGVWEMEFKPTKDGIETNFAVNHLAPMLFTLALLPRINASGGRIINTSSGAHRRNILDFTDLEWRKKPYNGVATYSQSKLCNILFTNRLAREVATTSILVNTVHPGYVKTDLFKHMDDRNWQGVPDAFAGARSAIFAATDHRIVNRSNLYIYQERIDPNLSDMAQDSALADELWERSRDYLTNYLSI